MKKRLTEKQINAIVELLKEGKPLPEEYRWLLFEGKQETELIYAGKTRDCPAPLGEQDNVMKSCCF